MKEWIKQHPVCFTVIVVSVLFFIANIIPVVLLAGAGMEIAKDAIEVAR